MSGNGLSGNVVMPLVKKEVLGSSYIMYCHHCYTSPLLLCLPVRESRRSGREAQNSAEVPGGVRRVPPAGRRRPPGGDAYRFPPAQSVENKTLPASKGRRQCTVCEWSPPVAVRWSATWGCVCSWRGTSSGITTPHKTPFEKQAGKLENKSPARAYVKYLGVHFLSSLLFLFFLSCHFSSENFINLKNPNLFFVCFVESS